MIYFGATDIPGLYNVVDSRFAPIASDVTARQLRYIAAERGEELQYVPPPESTFEVSGITFRTSDFVR